MTDKSYKTNMTNLIAPHGGYKNLKSFQTTEIIYDLTVEFCNRYMSYKTNKSYRTYDQMVQAARSGKQNISEGSQTSGTSKQSELRLIDVARASLQELLEDFKDFLRQHNLSIWDKDDVKTKGIRALAYKADRTYKTYMTCMSYPETAANCIICLIHQANYLLDQQLKALGKDLVREGDFKERYRDARKKEILGFNEPDYDQFLKQQGLKRLKDGRVVSLDDKVEE